MKKLHMNRVLIYILIFTIIVAIAIGGILLINNISTHNEFKKNITVSADGETTHVLNFENLKVLPGKAVEYVVNLQSSLNGDFIISLDFINVLSGGLENYVIVETEINGDKRKYSMTTLFNDVDIVYNSALFQSNELKIKYSIPDSVGNEAQGKFVKFDIKLKVANENHIN